jgi:hypothetical protein
MVKIFISHCSEDKRDVARPLATALIEDGYEVWFDEPIINGGDSIFDKINESLKTTDYGIVIFSAAFFTKRKWPMMELEALIAKETDVKKIIIPIWHQISFNDMKNNFPLLANRKGLSTDIGILKIVKQIKSAIERTDVNNLGYETTFLSKMRNKIFRPYIAATESKSIVERGSSIVFFGNTNTNSEFVYLNIFRLDSENPEGKIYKNSVSQDGTFTFEVNTYPLNKGSYGVLIELPSGGYTKLSFRII